MSSRDPIQVPLTGGVNRFTDALRIRDDEAVSIKNLYPSLDGKMEKRKGPAYYWRSSNGVVQTNRVPLNFWTPKFHEAGLVFVAQDTVTKATWLSVGQEGLFTTVAELQIAQPPSGYRPAIVEINNRILVLAGAVSGLGSSVYAVTADPVSPDLLVINEVPMFFTNAGGDFVAPRCVCVYQGRAVYGNFGPGLEDIFVFADSGQPYKINAGTAGSAPAQTLNVQTSGGRALELTQLQGDACVVMQEIAVKATSAPDEAALLVLGAHTAIFCPGVPLQTDDTPPPGLGYLGDLQPRAFNVPCGCVSADTLVKTPIGLLWASWNDVWALGTGGVPERVGTKIRPILSEGPASDRWRWHAAYCHKDGSYRLAIVPGEQTPSGGFIVDACQDQWWLDLRKGIPTSSTKDGQRFTDSDRAAWFGPHQFRMQSNASVIPEFPGTFYMRALERDGVAPKLIGTHVASLASGFSTVLGTRWPSFVEFDVTAGYDLAVPLTDDILARPNATDILPSNMVGNEISYEVLSKIYDFGDPMVDKGFSGMEVSAWVNDCAAVFLEVICDGGRDRLTCEVELDQFGYILGVDPLGTYLTHQYQAVAMLPVGGARIVGKVFQFRLYDVAGWPVPVNGVTSQIIAGALPNGDILTLPIVPGFYATRAAFLNALCVALGNIPYVPDPSEGWLNGVDSSTSMDLITIDSDSAGSTFQWQFEVLSAAFAEELRRSKKVASWLGFRTNLDVASVDGVKTAEHNVPLLRSAHMELVGLNLRMYDFLRRPSGGSYEPKIS